MFLVVIVCALIGSWLYGAPGFLVGGAVGFALGSLAKTAARRRLSQAQAEFVETTFAVMGALCKADGIVTQDEIQVVEQIFALLGLSPEQQQAAKTAFNRGKAPDFDLDAAVSTFAQSAPRSGTLLQLFLQLQLLAIAADGHVHPAEHAMLVRVARGLGLAERDVAQLAALLRAAASGPAVSDGASREQRLDDAYAALGVTPESSDDEIKRAYRKMMTEHHPDRLAARGLPESMRKVAEERTRTLNTAYDLIKKAREPS